MSWRGTPALMTRHIIALGTTRAGRDFAIARRSEAVSVITACTEGSGWVGVDGEPVRFRRGQAYRMPAGCWQCYWTGEAPWSLAWVCYAEDPRWPAAIDGSAGVLDGNGESLSALLAALRAERSGANEDAAIGHLAALIDLAARRLVGGVTKPDPLQEVWRSVEAELPHAWTLEDLARFAGMGVESLRLACRARTGRSPMAQLTYLRMQRASQLLAELDAPLATIAKLVGYGDPSAFSTAFHRCMGMAPAAYRGRLPRPSSDAFLSGASERLALPSPATARSPDPRAPARRSRRH
jgi:AraC-like DNA-binding protein